jgi:hypothetical protein
VVAEDPRRETVGPLGGAAKEGAGAGGKAPDASPGGAKTAPKAGGGAPDGKTFGPGAPEPEEPTPSMRKGAGASGSSDAASARPAVAGAPPGATSAPPRTVERVVERRGPGVLPLVLGGLLAGAIGYAVPAFLLPDDEPEAVVPAVDLGPIEAELAALRSDVSTLATVDAEAGPDEGAEALEARLLAIEEALAEAPAAAPPGEPVDLTGIETALTEQAATAEELRGALDLLSGSSESAGGERESLRGEIAALSEELGALPARLDALSGGQQDLTARIDAVAAAQEDLSARLDDLAAETEAVEAEAEAMVRAAALEQLAVAVDAGLPFSDQLGMLGDAVPLSLYEAASEGVASLDALRRAFADPARAALAEARAGEVATAAPDERLGTWLRRQLEARSVTPREGDDADAVLSRAEAALAEGDLGAALAEIETLPEEVRAPLADWEAAARERLAATSALAELTAASAAQDTTD